MYFLFSIASQALRASARGAESLAKRCERKLAELNLRDINARARSRQ